MDRKGEGDNLGKSIIAEPDSLVKKKVPSLDHLVNSILKTFSNFKVAEVTKLGKITIEVTKLGEITIINLGSKAKLDS